MKKIIFVLFILLGFQNSWAWGTKEVICDCHSTSGADYGQIAAEGSNLSQAMENARWRCAATIRTEYCDMSRGGCWANQFMHLVSVKNCNSN